MPWIGPGSNVSSHTAVTLPFLSIFFVISSTQERFYCTWLVDERINSMKKIWLVCFAGAALALNAQTNLPTPAPEPLFPPVTMPTGPGMAPRRDTQIDSDSGEFRQKTSTVIYRGNVRVNDPQMILTCDLLTLEAPKLPVGKFVQTTASGNVVIDFVDDKGQTNHATAGEAIYTYCITNGITNAVITLTNSPVVSSPQGVLRGAAVIWDRIHDTVFVPAVQTSIHPGTNTVDLFENVNRTTKTGTNSAVVAP